MKQYLIITYILVVSTLKGLTQNVFFQDANFKAALLVNPTVIDINGDLEIQVSEANGFHGTIDVHSKNISNLTGIESFTNLDSLKCYYNNIASLDISNNQVIKYIDCYNSYIQNLNITNCSSLQILNCGSNQLTNLNVTSNTNLVHLSCYDNVLSNLNLTQNLSLKTINCFQTNLSNLDLTQNTLLERIYVGRNNLYNFDVSFNPNLINLDVSENHLTNLNLTNNFLLETLYSCCNNLVNLDVSSCPNLTHLVCFDNYLNALDITQNPLINTLYCENNQLTTLNLKNNNNYNIFDNNFHCYSNPLVCIEVNWPIWCSANWHHIDNDDFFSIDCSAIGIENVTKSELIQKEIYPNPNTGIFNIINQDMSRKYFTIKNILGETILIKQIKDKENLIDLGNQDKGMYFYFIEQEGEIINEGKIIIE